MPRKACMPDAPLSRSRGRDHGDPNQGAHSTPEMKTRENFVRVKFPQGLKCLVPGC